MDKLLDFIIKYCSYLYKNYGFRFINSRVSNGSALVILESDELVMQIVIDREQFRFYFQAASEKKKNRWYDLEIVRNFILHPNLYQLNNATSKPDDAYNFELQYKKAIEGAHFIEDNMLSLIKIFSRDAMKETIAVMDKLKRQRSKKLFG